MYCPNCGANSTTKHSFCRSCGLNLQDAARSLLAQIPSAETARLLRREKKIEHFGNFALGGLGAVGIVAVTAGLWFLITKFIVTGTNIFIVLLLIAFVFFAFLSLIFVVFNEGLKEKKPKLKSTDAPEKNEITATKSTGKLLADNPFEPIPSVVENSTELLAVENKTRKFE